MALIVNLKQRDQRIEQKNKIFQKWSFSNFPKGLVPAMDISFFLILLKIKAFIKTRRARVT
jgi:hypothetical protein